ncbi:FAD-dependent oxidoreductase [Synechococcus sp. MU1625]|uniref:flavin monoamine oxidase family protein n=1 Tax=Synechococcus sp. MU1625 TaxID=2508347 RepID=UPI001CF9240C|nr:FAD-dependent oxidoreductase [Synechococcus sp. MU1625]
MNEFSTIIIGAGISGCLASYRLQTRLNQSQPPVLLIEQSSTVGGRIHSVDDGSGTFMEFGAMRISENHQEVIALCDELGIELEEFYGIFNQNSYIYINGFARRLGHQNPHPDDLLQSALSSFTHRHPSNKNDTHSNNSLLSCLEVDFKCSYLQLSFQAVLKHVMTTSQYEYYRSLIGYDYLFGHDISFYGVLYSNRCFTQNSKFYRPKVSMSEITDQLSTHFVDSGGFLKLNCKALSISKQDDFYCLITSDGVFKAKTVISTMSIKQCLNFDGLESTGISRSLLSTCSQCVGQYASTKVFALFEQSRFDNLKLAPVLNCQVFRTDLPLRQGIYPRINNQNQTSMLVGYKNNGFDDINIDSLTTSECSELLSKINGFTVAKPKEIYSYNWLQSPSGLASHYLKIGNNYTDFLPLVNTGSERVYFIGEAFSTQHGWIAGAIESVNNLLEKI